VAVAKLLFVVIFVRFQLDLHIQFKFNSFKDFFFRIIQNTLEKFALLNLR